MEILYLSFHVMLLVLKFFNCIWKESQILCKILISDLFTLKRVTEKNTQNLANAFQNLLRKCIFCNQSHLEKNIMRRSNFPESVNRYNFSMTGEGNSISKFNSYTNPSLLSILHNIKMTKQ